MAKNPNPQDAPATTLALAMMAALERQGTREAAETAQREYQAAQAQYERDHAKWRDELHPAWQAECQRIEALRTRYHEIAALPKCTTKDGKLARNIKASKDFIAETGITCATDIPELPAEPTEPQAPTKPTAPISAAKPAAIKATVPTAPIPNKGKRGASIPMRSRLEDVLDLLTNPESTIDAQARADLEAELAEINPAASQMYQEAKASKDLLALPADQRERLVRAMLKRERKVERHEQSVEEANRQGRIDQIIKLLSDPQTKGTTYQRLMDELAELAPNLVREYEHEMVEGTVVAVIGDRFPKKLPLFAHAARITVEGPHPGQRDRDESVIEVTVDSGKRIIRFDPKLTASMNIQKEMGALAAGDYQKIMRLIADLPEAPRRDDSDDMRREKQKATQAVLNQVERVNAKLARLIGQHLRFRGPRSELRNLKSILAVGKKVRVSQYEQEGVLITEIGTARYEDEPTHVLDALWGWGAEVPNTLTLSAAASSTGSMCFFLAEIGAQCEIADPNSDEPKPRYFGRKGMEFDAHARDNELLGELGAVYIPEPAPPAAVFRDDIVVGDASGIFTREVEKFDPLALLGEAVIDEPDLPFAAMVQGIGGDLDNQPTATAEGSDDDPLTLLRTSGNPPTLGVVNGGKAAAKTATAPHTKQA